MTVVNSQIRARFENKGTFADCCGAGLWLNLPTMPQTLLPLFHEGTQLITPVQGYRCEGNEVVYLHGMIPVFLHQTDAGICQSIRLGIRARP